jgi:hypothetical protein
MSGAIAAFVSYNSADKEFARKLAADLESQGIKVWLDQWAIRGGESISDKVQQGINTSDVFIVILSRSSVRSRWVKEELRS